MTSIEFEQTFYGPANELNRERFCEHLGITGFAGLPLKRIGWVGFVHVVGNYYGLDIRDFTCYARFEDAVAEKVSK